MLISTTNLVSIVPRAVATSFLEPSRLQILEPPIALPDIPIAYHWAKRSQHDPAVSWLVALVEELFLGRDPTQ
ncbi:conserved protein of unknown function (plasmid) [Methylocella tundrae]|uniref:LysR substrate-binding domain-containing protein n=2 Tax=Methylocella tundrae TaxID=227605 RepID=A0A4U8Z737_METTU|nr:conserved protein of unknown function [Methylocella tundrae]